MCEGERKQVVAHGGRLHKVAFIEQKKRGGKAPLLEEKPKKRELRRS